MGEVSAFYIYSRFRRYLYEAPTPEGWVLESSIREAAVLWVSHQLASPVVHHIAIKFIDFIGRVGFKWAEGRLVKALDRALTPHRMALAASDPVDRCVLLSGLIQEGDILRGEAFTNHILFDDLSENVKTWKADAVEKLRERFSEGHVIRFLATVRNMVTNPPGDWEGSPGETALQVELVKEIKWRLSILRSFSKEIGCESS